MKVCITVDLDNYQDYESLVDDRCAERPPSFYADALPRFLDLFERNGVRATLFAIGRDLADPANRRALREAAARGHEIGNHSYAHPYNFRSLSRARKAEEIDGAAAAIADAVGVAPVGFRTPSCDVDAETLELLAERGYLYESSVFPSPIMWAFMLYGRLFVRRADYQLGSPLAVLAPARPYEPRAARPFRAARARGTGLGLLEIPFSVATPLRIPFYSTLMRRLGPRAFDALLRAHGERDLLHALFHLIELADLRGTSLGDALDRAPGLGVPFEARCRFLEHAVAALARRGQAVPLREVAEAQRRRDAAAA